MSDDTQPEGSSVDEGGPPIPDFQDGEGTDPLIRRIGLWLGPVVFALLLAWDSDVLDSSQRRVAAVTAWTAVWWLTSALPIGVTSLLPAALFPLVGVMGGREVTPLYMKDIVFLFLGAFVVALGLERWNVHKRMAFLIIAKVGTSPRRLVLGFMAAAAFLSMWINNTSTTLMLLPIGLAVVASLGDEAKGKSAFATALLLGIAYASSVGGTASLIGTAPNQVFADQLETLFPDERSIDFGTWILAFVPLAILFVPLAWWLLTRVALRVPDSAGSALSTIQAQRAALGPVGKGEKLMIAVFATTAILWVTRAGFDLGSFTIPGWAAWVAPSSVDDPNKFITDATVATVMAVLCFVIPVDRQRGVYLMDWPTALKMPWEVLLLLGSGFAIAGAFKSTGLDQVLGGQLAPLLVGQSDWLVAFYVVVFMAALTEITSNTATTIVLLPVLGNAAVAADLSPMMTMVPATLAASCAFMLPVATPPNAVVFSSRLIPIPKMARVGIWINLLMALLIPLVFQLWIRRILEI